MYKIKVPYKNFLDQPKNTILHFNLTETEVIKLLREFKAIFAWRDKMEGEERQLDEEEVIEFYNNFEAIMLEAWGEPSEDGEYFRKTGRYEFEESAKFNAVMLMVVTDPRQATAFVDGIMPKGMEELVRKADESLADMAKESTDAAQQAEIQRLRARLAEAEGSAGALPSA